jgi:hypothetical protein
MSSSKLILLYILFFSFGCTNSIKKQNTTLPTPKDSIFQSPENKKEQSSDINEKIKATEETLKKHSKVFGIENLKQKRNLSDFEIRIWSDDVTFLHCLLITNKDGKWKASMLTGDMMLNRRTGYLYLKKTKSLKNLFPKSGWKEISNIFSRKGIRFPFLYKIDELNKPPEPDEGLVKLEFKSEKQYGLVFYQKLSDSRDAKKIIELCKRLQNEFNVDLGC